MSATPTPRLPVALLREAVRRAAESTSTHQVAEAIGMSQGGVRKLLAGAEPHAATVLKLTSWYVRQAAHAHELDADTAAAALALLVDAAPAGERESLRRALVRQMRDAHTRGGAEPPAWLRDE
jgi:hypothetical protein